MFPASAAPACASASGAVLAVTLYGDFAGNPYGSQALRLVAVGRKP